MNERRYGMWGEVLAFVLGACTGIVLMACLAMATDCR